METERFETDFAQAFVVRVNQAANDRRQDEPPKRAFQSVTCSSVILANRTSAGRITVPASSWASNSLIGPSGHGRTPGADWIVPWMLCAAVGITGHARCPK